jgi:hypothetical protein
MAFQPAGVISMLRAPAGRSRRDHHSVTWRIIGAITIGKGRKLRHPEMLRKRAMSLQLMMPRDVIQCNMTL